MPPIETIIRDRAYLASVVNDADERARIFREIEKMAADAARKIERAQTKAES